MINEIKIGGELRPVKFGFNSLAEFGRITGLKLQDLQNLGSSLTIEQVIVLVWCGLRYGAKKEGKPFDYTVEDVGDWLDEDPNLVAEMLNTYGESQAPFVPEKAGKKKPIRGK